jgi:hypothetical protein
VKQVPAIGEPGSRLVLRRGCDGVLERLDKKKMQSSIVVFGATGFAGRHITNEVLDRGRDVRGAARDILSLDKSSN